MYTIISTDVDSALVELFDIANIMDDDVELVSINDNNDGTYSFSFEDIQANYVVNYCI